MDFRKEYFEWKEKYNYTQDQAAEFMGSSRAAVASFETGRNPLPRAETVLRMLSVLRPGWDSPDRRVNDHTCHACDELVPGPLQGAKHCLMCGDSFADNCHRCGVVCPKGANYCHECGYNLKKQRA